MASLDFEQGSPDIEEMDVEAAYYMTLYSKCTNALGMQFCWPKDGGMFDQDLDVVLVFETIKGMLAAEANTSSDGNIFKTRHRSRDRW